MVKNEVSVRVICDVCILISAFHTGLYKLTEAVSFD